MYVVTEVKTKKGGKAAENKVKALKLGTIRLLVDGAYGKTFSSGKTGFFGKATDMETGDRYQIVGAVKLS